MTGLIQFQGGGAAAFRPRTSVTDDDGHGEMMHTVPDFSSGGKSKEFDPTPAAAAMSPPSRRPAPPAEIFPSSYIMTSYLKPTIVRQRPRMWMGDGGCGGGGLGASAARHSSAAAVSSTQHSSGSKRPRHYESDDEDDSSSSSDEDEEEELPIEFSSPLPPPPPRKVGRRSRTHQSPFLATSGGPPRHRWAPVSSSGISRPSCNFRKSVVTFSRPLVTLVRFRPRTSPDEKAGLYFCRDDQNRFRAEYREEKRRRMMGEWESEDDDDDDDDDDIIEAKGNGDDPNDAGDDSVGHDDEPANQENGPEDVDAIPVTVEKSQEGGKEDNKGEDDVHEVTESSSSNEDESSDGEDEDGDEAAH